MTASFEDTIARMDLLLLRTRAIEIRRRAAARAVEVAYENLARSTRRIPLVRPDLHQVELITGLRYGDAPEHSLDIYRPMRPGPHPVVFYVHGGAFRSLSKDTHWIMGLALARRGFLAVLPNYRMAPQVRYPTPLADVAEAYAWTGAHVASHGGDPRRIAVAGESAGGNLTAALALCTAYRRSEGWAARAYAAPPPVAALPICGILEVSDPSRFSRRRRLPVWLDDQLVACSHNYLGPEPAMDLDLDLANPLWLLERGVRPDRPLPPFFAPVGTKDPLLDDTRRLARALAALGVPCEARYYPGEIHAFHALIWRAAARQCWRDMDAFLRAAMERAAQPELASA